MPSQIIDHDDFIIKMLASDDGQALTILYKTHYPVLRKVLFQMISDYDTIDDILQELFMNIWTRRHSIKLRKPISSYLVTAALNKARNHIRDHKRTRIVLTDTLKTYEQMMIDLPADSNVSVHEIHKLWKIARSKMSDQTKIILLLHRTQKLTYHQIADYLQISNKTVEKHISIALKILKEVFKSYLNTFLFLLMIIMK